MPQLLNYIDAIARKKKRDVLYLTFFEDETGRPLSCDWRDNQTRAALIEWLDANGISWEACGEFASTTTMRGYRGTIYIDLPYDEADPQYQVLQQYLERPDGSMRFPNMLFMAMTLDVAMQNAEHDAPGFWERWAENF